MATVTPVSNSSLPLAVPGYPMVSVPISNPAAAKEILNDKTDGTQTAEQTAALLQSGHMNDRVV